MLLPHLFECGTMRPDRSDRTLKFEIRSLRNLLERVIPFFEEYPLLTAKRRDFELFSDICRLMSEGAHLQGEGILVIAELAEQMNSSGIRKYTTDMIEASL